MTIRLLTLCILSKEMIFVIIFVSTCHMCLRIIFLCAKTSKYERCINYCTEEKKNM